MSESDELARAEQDYRAAKANLEHDEYTLKAAEKRLRAAIRKLDLPREPSA